MVLDVNSADWFDLSIYPNSFDLGLAPSDYWLLITYHIILKHHDKHYIVIEYPSYAMPTLTLPEVYECIWSTPYSAFRMEIGPHKYRVISHIKKLFDKYLQENDKNIQHTIEYKFYHMGISHHIRTPMADIFEVKRSPREPDKWKCFFIKRYIISGLDPLGKYNIVDPECLMPYKYLCLEDSGTALVKPDSSRSYQLLFRGKPLATNVGHLFFKNEADALKDYATQIAASDFYHDETGFLLSFDLVSFGKFHRLVVENFKTLDQTGSEIALGFIVQLDSIFRRHLDAYRFHQIRLQGDGFVATSPQRHHRHYTSESTPTHAQVNNTLTLIKLLREEINNTIKTYPINFGCRCVLLWGKYAYGKIGGFYSDKADFAGESLITLTRIEERLKRWQQQNETREGVCCIAVIPEVYDEYKEIFTHHDFVFRTKICSKEKESVVKVCILTNG